MALRERLTLVMPQVLQAVAALEQPPAEWAALVTCHRIELFMAPDGDEAPLVQRLMAILHEQTGVAPEAVAAGMVIRRGEEVARHLCRVAAGLDSAVLGEAQIQGQVVAAYTQALKDGTIGPTLSLLFRTAIRTGKRARSETTIGVRTTSMSSLALRLTEQQRGSLADARVLVIGAGEMGRLALKALAARRMAAVTVANRSLANAHAALLDTRWRACGLDALPELLAEADVVVSATGAPDLIITADQVAQAGADRPRYFVDLAVPRDLDPALRDMPHVTLIDVDDLREELDSALADRLDAVPAVEAVIQDELAQWRSAMTELTVRPLVVELRRRAEAIRQEEVARTLRFIGDADEATQAHIQHLSRALVNKLLHEPTTCIRELAHQSEAGSHAATIRRLFGLNGHTADSQPKLTP